MGHKFKGDDFEVYLRYATIIQSPSDSSDRFSSTSSTSSSIIGVGDFVRRRFFDFFVDASASAFSTTSRISRVLKTNFPFIATLFPLVRLFRYYSSSRTSVFLFRRRTRSVFDFSKVEVSRAIYRFVGDKRFVDFRTVSSSSSFAFRISVPLGGELARSVVSRADTFGLGVIGRVVESGISRVDRTVISENG